MAAGMDKLRKDHLPADLLPLIDAAGVGATVAVQARQCLEESTWLLQLADQYPFIGAVVGWVDLSSEHVVEQLEQLCNHLENDLRSAPSSVPWSSPGNPQCWQ